MSLYIDLPLSKQIEHSFKNKAYAVFLQNNGISVIPNVRWADERSFEFCFDGIQPNGIYAVSTHGCVKSKDQQKMFKTGLKEMLKRLAPRCTVVHGSMPDYIFAEYKKIYKFVRFDSWIERQHNQKGGDNEWEQLKLDVF